MSVSINPEEFFNVFVFSDFDDFEERKPVIL